MQNSKVESSVEKEQPDAKQDKRVSTGNLDSKDRGLPMGGSYDDVDAEGGSRSGSNLPSQRH